MSEELPTPSSDRSGVWARVVALPLWVKIAVPVAVLILALGGIAIGRGGKHRNLNVESAPKPTSAASTTSPTDTTATTVAPTTTPAATQPPATQPSATVPATQPSATVPTTRTPATVAAGVVSAKIVLPSQTITAGASMSGTVVVDNTGPLLHVTACGSYFAVALGNDTITPNLVWPACAMDFTIPTGVSTYPVTVTASYGSCTGPPAAAGLPLCNPDGSVPPLPPGAYQAMLFQNPSPTQLPISVTPIPVTVT